MVCSNYIHFTWCGRSGLGGIEFDAVRLVAEYKPSTFIEIVKWILVILFPSWQIPSKFSLDSKASIRRKTTYEHFEQMKKALFWIIFFIVGITSPLLALELAGRAYMSIKHGVEGKSYGLWQADEELGAIHKPNAYNSNASTNNWGFRNDEDIEANKAENSLRLIAYGGSTTFCYNLTNQQAWPLQLQTQLRNKEAVLSKEAHTSARRIEVLNAGAIQWSIGHAYARAKRDIPALKPDYVIIYSGINELGNSNYLYLAGTPISEFVARGEYGQAARNFDQSRWGKRNLFLVRLYDYRIKPLLQKISDRTLADQVNTSQTNSSPDAAKLMEQRVAATETNYQQSLIKFIDLIKQNGAKPIFIIQAHNPQQPKLEQYTGYSRRAASIATEHGALVLDAQQMVDQATPQFGKLFADSGVHLNTRGAELLANFIVDNISF